MSYRLQCFNAASNLYPSASREQVIDLLWCATCFPFGTVGEVREQLKEHITCTDGTLEAAITRAEEEITEQLARVKSEEIKVLER